MTGTTSYVQVSNLSGTIMERRSVPAWRACHDVTLLCNGLPFNVCCKTESCYQSRFFSFLSTWLALQP